MVLVARRDTKGEDGQSLGATRADGVNERSEIEGKSLRAVSGEGATRADGVNERSEIEGKSLRAVSGEGATRAPLIDGEKGAAS